MGNAPGFLQDLDEQGLDAWGQYLGGVVADAAADGQQQWGRTPAVLTDGDPALGGLNAIDWPPDPVRIIDFLPDVPSDQVAAFLDWTNARGQIGRCLLHEEYLEWRVVRDAQGAIERIEMSCETPDYMAYVAGYAPERLLALAAQFAGEPAADAQDIFGVSDYRSFTPEDRISAFRLRHISRGAIPVSNYGNGNKALLCMSQSVNSLAAAVNLAVRAAFPWSTDGRPLTGPEAIVGEGWAAACRNSDPHIATTVIRAVHGGKRVALADPAGIYMLPFRTDQVTLDDEPLPDVWLNYSRGAAAADNPLGRDLSQRLVIAPPAGSGRTIADLVDANGDTVTTGLQVARHQSVSILYRITGDADVERIEFLQTPTPEACGTANDQAAAYQDLFRRYRQGVQPTLAGLATRVSEAHAFDV
ncbi:MAG TPA: hypothetical protein VF680_07395 [Allosphingosinicella sp.]|jgi:hypothetical protein